MSKFIDSNVVPFMSDISCSWSSLLYLSFHDVFKSEKGENAFIKQ